MNDRLKKYFELYKTDWNKAKLEMDNYYNDFDERLDIICCLMCELEQKEKRIKELEKINEEHKEINGNLRQELKELKAKIRHLQLTNICLCENNEYNKIKRSDKE